MARFQYPNFVGASYNGRSVSMASDRCINLYPEVIESGTGKNQMALIGTPGIREACNTGKQEPIRGISSIGAKRILAAGYETLYEINPTTGAVVTLGAIAPDAAWEGLGAVKFAFNGTEYAICSGGHGYILNGNTLTEVIGMEDLAYLDGYFIAIESGGSKKIRISGLYDGLTWNELDFKERESARDYPAAIVADHGELWIFGEQSTEIWYDSGNADFPFDRLPNGRLELGISSRWSPAKVDNSVFWVGSDERGNKVVWRAEGYNAKRISTHAIEYRMNLMIPQPTAPGITGATTTFAIGWTYQEEGHSFYCLLFPKAPGAWSQTADPYTNPTMLVYDCATNLWHERAWWNKANGKFEPPRQRCHAYIWDTHLVGDRENGKIYQQHLDYYDDDGDRIRRERIGTHLSAGMKQMFYRSFQLDMELAVGLGAIDSDLYGPDSTGTHYDI